MLVFVICNGTWFCYERQLVAWTIATVVIASVEAVITEKSLASTLADVAIVRVRIVEVATGMSSKMLSRW